MYTVCMGANAKQVSSCELECFMECCFFVCINSLIQKKLTAQRLIVYARNHTYNKNPTHTVLYRLNTMSVLSVLSILSSCMFICNTISVAQIRLPIVYNYKVFPIGDLLTFWSIAKLKLGGSSRAKIRLNRVQTFTCAACKLWTQAIIQMRDLHLYGRVLNTLLGCSWRLVLR